jgi:hypothetical protein
MTMQCRWWWWSLAIFSDVLIPPIAGSQIQLSNHDLETFHDNLIIIHPLHYTSPFLHVDEEQKENLFIPKNYVLLSKRAHYNYACQNA